MNYHHLTIEERSCIRKYYVDGLSYREIARLIGRNVSTVSREIRRNCTHMYDIPTYYPHTAQKKYLLRRSYCHRGMFRSQEVIEYIEEKLRATWSPEQIACTPCELKIPSWRTIYRWIYEKYLVNGNLKVLRWKGKSHGSKETRGKYSKGKSIRKRDKSVYSRKEAGHWEADTVVSGQGKSKACFATPGRTQDTLLHCREDAGSAGRDHGERHCRCTVCLPTSVGQDDHLRPGLGICQLAQNRRTAALRGLFCRPLLCLAERHKRESQRSA